MLRLVLVSFLALAACSREQAPPPPSPSDAITPRLERLAERARPGALGVFMMDLKSRQWRGVNADALLPLQSVFKLPLGIVVLDLADKGKLSLDDKVVLTKDQLSLAHSPIADGFPAKKDYTIEELVRAAVAESDNSAADILMKRVGGPGAVTAFFRDRGIADFRVDRYEYELQPQAVGLPKFTGQWIGSEALGKAQAAIPVESQKAAMTLYLADPRDRVSPRTAGMILDRLAAGKLLSPQSTAKMMEILRGTTTGPNRIKAGAPPDAIVYHKTGTGPDVDGINSATNDIGIIELKDGRKIAVAVFLSGSRMKATERDAIIAEVALIATDKLAAGARVP